MWTCLCMHLQSECDDNDQVGLDALCLVSVFPPSAPILFFFNFVINISFLMLCCINCFYNESTVKPFEPNMFVQSSAVIKDYPLYGCVGVHQRVSDIGSCSEKHLVLGCCSVALLLYSLSASSDLFVHYVGQGLK